MCSCCTETATDWLLLNLIFVCTTYNFYYNLLINLQYLALYEKRQMYNF